jgi:SAM-dependent methyltransferase
MTEPDFLRRTRASYDELAADYAEWITGELAARPLDRAMLAAFAELVGDSGPVADIGCGPGGVTRHLADLGLAAFGIDLSPEMIAVARRTHPGLRFEVGSMLDLDLKDEGLAGIVAWYSIIHIPDELLPAVFAEFYRVLAPGGHLLLGFQIGDENLRLTDARGHEVALDFQRRQPERVAGLLSEAGLVPHARLRREAESRGQHTESTPQGFLLARKPR